MKLKCRKLA